MSSYVTHMMIPTMMTMTAMINTKKTTPTPAATPPTLLALVGSGTTGTRWGNRYSNVTIVIVAIVIVTIVIDTIVTITTVSGAVNIKVTHLYITGSVREYSALANILYQEHIRTGD